MICKVQLPGQLVTSITPDVWVFALQVQVSGDQADDQRGPFVGWQHEVGPRVRVIPDRIFFIRIRRSSGFVGKPVPGVNDGDAHEVVAGLGRDKDSRGKVSRTLKGQSTRCSRSHDNVRIQKVKVWKRSRLSGKGQIRRFPRDYLPFSRMHIEAKQKTWIVDVYANAK